MSRKCEDNRRLDILVSVKAQVPLKYFWRIEVVGHLDIAGLKISRIIRLFRDLVARSLDPRKFPLYFRLFTFSKGSNTFSRLFAFITPCYSFKFRLLVLLSTIF